MFTIHLAKEPFKFSCSHFTILSADRAERLHGHNYQVTVDIQVERIDENLGMAFDFNEVKPKVKGLCDRLDERILLPSKSEYLALKSSAHEIEVTFNNKRYLFPTEDAVLLPLRNITAEELSRHLGQELAKIMQPLDFWTAIELHVEETRGQSVSFHIQR